MNRPDNEHARNENVLDHFRQVQRLLEEQTLAETSAHQSESPRDERHELLEKMVHKRHLTEMQKILDELHPADTAYILEALPMEQRLQVWNLLKTGRKGEILIDLPEAVRESLIAVMSREELCETAGHLHTDEIADLAPDLPQNVMRDVFKSLSIDEREQLRMAMSYSDDSVGALMDFNLVHVREDVRLDVVSRYLRRLGKLPAQTDQVFVVDCDDIFKGVLPINLIVVGEPKTLVGQLMQTDAIRLNPDDKADQVAPSFERYGLVSVPVVDEEGRLAGRVTVKAVLDFVRARAETDLLKQAGLREDEDIFASVWKSLQNRWIWLALNLCAVFFASRVIGSFEDTIALLVALATLMPIVAGIASYSANQTMTVIVRALALKQLSRNNVRRLMYKELAIGGLNGLALGSIAGLFAFFLYYSVLLGLVMASAMLLNLIVGTITGVSIPLVMHKLGRDPGIGSSVMITAITSSSGFFIFLGLATIFLI